MSRTKVTIATGVTLALFAAMGTCGQDFNNGEGSDNGEGFTIGQDFSIDWHTIDGGGETWSTGGDYELGGTIGQPDAGVISGGTYTLTGGFWAVPPCWCLADVSNDGQRDGEDVQAFVECMVATGANCACADVDTDGELDMDDVTTFVDDLLAGSGCPGMD